MKHYLVYGKVNTLDFGIGISGLETHRSPQRSGSFVSVPGMDGDMFIPNNRFDSIKIIYKCYIPSEFMKNWEAFKGLLMSQADDYHMLSDTYHPEYYRMAMLTEAINPEVGTINEYGQFTLTFHCKPNCYLRSGEKAVQLRNGGIIYNPTHYGAFPIIRAYGVGNIRIGKNNIVITKAGTQYIDIDTKSEMRTKAHQTEMTAFLHPVSTARLKKGAIQSL